MIQPDDASAHNQLGNLLLHHGNADEAERHFMAALQSRPDYPEAHYQLAVILAGRKQIAEAIPHLREAVRLKPDWLEALNNLAWILATQADEKLRNGPEAIGLAAHAVELTRTNHAGALDTLAAAYAEAGRFAEARQTVRQALDLAEAARQAALVTELRSRLELYQTKTPYRLP
jgi:Flp pilus assembly protein TadD